MNWWIVNNIVAKMLGYRPPHGSLISSCFYHNQTDAQFPRDMNYPVSRLIRMDTADFPLNLLNK